MRWQAPALGLAAATLYWITGPTGPGTDAFVPLADAILHGHLWIEPRPWMELVPTADPQRWYVPFAPAPVLTLLPLVAVVPDLASNAMASLLGGANVALVYLLLRAWGCSLRTTLWLTVAFALTVHWWVAGMAGTHHYAQVCGVFFLLGALNLAIRGRWPVAAGLLLGLAAASRLPMGLALPALLALYGWRPRAEHLQLLAGVLVPALLVVGYNLARFGDPLQFGYALIPSSGGPITSEWWYANGIESLSYVPRSLYWMLLAGYSTASTGASVTMTAPFLFWAIEARGRMAAVLGVSVVLVMLPDLAHGAWGFAQFGYRFILDAVPLLLLLIGSAYRAGPSVSLRLAILASIAAYAVGMGIILLAHG